MVTKNKNQISRERSISALSEAAFSLINERGYHATSLEAIAKEAGLTKGSIYFFFGSKEKLIEHLFEIVRKEVLEPQLVAFDEAQGCFVDKVVSYIHVGSLTGVERPGKLLFLIRMSIEFGTQDNPIGEGVRSLYERVYEKLEAAYDDERKKEGATLGPSAKVISSIVISLHDGMMLQYNLRRREITGEELVRNVRMLVLNGLGSRPS